MKPTRERPPRGVTLPLAQMGVQGSVVGRCLWGKAVVRSTRNEETSASE